MPASQANAKGLLQACELFRMRARSSEWRNWGACLTTLPCARIWQPGNGWTDALARPPPDVAIRAYIARFGRLYLEGGARDGVQIVPADWVAASVNPAAPHLQPGENPASSWTFGYGHPWWIPEDPQGDVLAIGVWGRHIHIDPAREVVIVKTSADPDFDDNDPESVAAFRAIARAVATD